MSNRKTGKKTICLNKKASFNFELGERYEAGLVLMGTEVKSLRLGKGNLTDAYAQISDRGEIFLHGMHISPYPWASLNNHQPKRARKLLLNAKEIKRISAGLEEKGLTLVPTRLYFKNSLVKVELALAKGKKLYDKRHSLKEADAKREISRVLRERNR